MKRNALGTATQAMRALDAFAPTCVFESFWRFAHERQAIYLRRLENAPPPWTDDPILQRFKFTNAYRAADRVSQFLIDKVIYDERRSSDPSEVVFRTLLFKFFNRIDTWTALERELGTLSWQSFDAGDAIKVLDQLAARGQRIYSGAFIIPPVALPETGGIKHRGHIQLLRLMMEDRIVQRLRQAPSLASVFDILCSYPSIGRFLGYQLAIDLNYSAVINFDESEFVVAGPGALDGLSKCFANCRAADPAAIIALVTQSQSAQFERLGLTFPGLFGRPLQLIDCQNLFCEISKYARAAHPDVAGVAGRTRIKQRFTATPHLPSPRFPGKWGLSPPQSRSQQLPSKRG